MQLLVRLEIKSRASFVSLNYPDINIVFLIKHHNNINNVIQNRLKNTNYLITMNIIYQTPKSNSWYIVT